MFAIEIPQHPDDSNGRTDPPRIPSAAIPMHRLTKSVSGFPMTHDKNSGDTISDQAAPLQIKLHSYPLRPARLFSCGCQIFANAGSEGSSNPSLS
jgi:hypothetical protein